MPDPRDRRPRLFTRQVCEGEAREPSTGLSRAAFRALLPAQLSAGGPFLPWTDRASEPPAPCGGAGPEPRKARRR